MRHRDQGDQSYQLLACSIAAQSNKFFRNYSKRYTSKYKNMTGRGDFVASNFGSGSQSVSTSPHYKMYLVWRIRRSQQIH